MEGKYMMNETFVIRFQNDFDKNTLFPEIWDMEI